MLGAAVVRAGNSGRNLPGNLASFREASLGCTRELNKAACKMTN